MDNVHILAEPHLEHGNALPAFNSAAQFHHHNDNSVDLQLLAEQLQRSIILPDVLNTFADFITDYIDFVGLQFHSSIGVSEISNNVNNMTPTIFDIDVEQEHLGQLVYFSPRALSTKLKHTLQQWHKVLAYPLRNALMYTRVLQLATRDPLTGLSNRGDFDKVLAKQLECVRRRHRSFSLMLLDLDNFKQVNDNHGHQMGDQTLIEFAAILNRCVRGTDSVFRFGGDEFAIILDDNQLTSSEVVAKRIIKTVKDNSLLKQHGITTSIGLALATSKDNQTSVFARADKALYQVKRNGRNGYFSCNDAFLA